jgi:hypothetical protein
MPFPALIEILHAGNTFCVAEPVLGGVLNVYINIGVPPTEKPGLIPEYESSPYYASGWPQS